MVVSYARHLLLGLCAVAGCASSGVALRGDSEGPNVSLHIEAEMAPGDKAATARLKVEVENHAEDAVGIDVDAMRLRDAHGQRYAPLGQERRFVGAGAKRGGDGDGEAAVRRVPHGAVTIAPGAKQAIALEFADLPPTESYSLVMPQLYRLGIAGQIGLRAIRVPLRAVAAAEPAGDGGFYDPFEE